MGFVFYFILGPLPPSFPARNGSIQNIQFLRLRKVNGSSNDWPNDGSNQDRQGVSSKDRSKENLQLFRPAQAHRNGAIAGKLVLFSSKNLPQQNLSPRWRRLEHGSNFEPPACSLFTSESIRPFS